MKLLIVDDSNIIRRSIHRTVTGQGDDLDIRTASNGVMALDVFREFLPDVITMDITMPEMDGLTCVEEILKLKPESRILVISALADKATAIEALKRGAEAFLCKPFTADELNQTIAEILES